MVKKLAIIFYIVAVLLIAGFATYSKANKIEEKKHSTFQESM